MQLGGGGTEPVVLPVVVDTVPVVPDVPLVLEDVPKVDPEVLVDVEVEVPSVEDVEVELVVEVDIVVELVVLEEEEQVRELITRLSTAIGLSFVASAQ